jgi:malate synthase
VPAGEITEAGLRSNISIGIQYMAAWLGGNGCVPLHHLMEDAATAEIARAQVWQWIRHASELADGRTVTYALYEQLRDEELAKISEEVGTEAFSSGKYREAAALLDRITGEKHCMDFLTLVAYEAID